MIKLTFIDIFLRLIPESILFIILSYVLFSKKLERDKIALSTLILSVGMFFIRSLPISFGVHTLILIAFYTVVVTIINKIEVIKAISGIMISVIVMFAVEAVNVIILINVLKIDIAKAFENSLSRNLYGLPSLVLFGLILALASRIMKRRNKN